MKFLGKCKICSEIGAKYKCPKCLLPYCSVACYKTHNSSDNCNRPIVAKKIEEAKEETTTPDILIPEKNLKKLQNSEKVKSLLCNPHLRKMLLHLDQHANHDNVEKAMHEPIFVEFADACLSVVDHED